MALAERPVITLAQGIAELTNTTSAIKATSLLVRDLMPKNLATLCGKPMAMVTKSPKVAVKPIASAANWRLGFEARSALKGAISLGSWSASLSFKAIGPPTELRAA
jgi:hypothetical protein